MIGTRSSSQRAFALLLAWAAAVVGLCALNPGVARAATPQVSFSMTSITVSGTKPDDQVTVQGTVTNTGDLPAYGVQVLLWGSRDPIRDLATLRRARTNATGWGVRLPINSDHYAVITTSHVAFAPGASQPIELRATLRDLGISTRGAAYAFGADVLAAADPNSSYAVAGQLRTFIPVPGTQKVPVTSIVLLAATPTKLVNNLFRTDDLTAELSGRLENLLTAAGRPGMSWLIDPALLDEVRDMADGYQVADGEKKVPGAGQQVAVAWLARFDKLDRKDGGRTMFASPDVNAVGLDGDNDIVHRAAQASGAVSGVENLPLVVVPAGHILPSAGYDYLADSGATAIIATNTAAAGALQSGPADPLVLAASAEVPGPAETPGVERRQLALAAAAIAGTKGQLRLLTGLSHLAEDEATSAGWMERRGLGELLQTEPRVVSLTAEEPPGLRAAQWDVVERLNGEFDAYGDLVPNSALTGQADAAITRATASAWIQDPQGFDDHASGLGSLVGTPTVGEAVVLEASARFLMSSKTNQFPVTVTNNLTEEIRVQVVVRTDNPQRLTVPPSEVVTVEAGQSMTVNIRPEATANGLVIARAHVATAQGHRVTPDTSITVEITDLGVVAWIIVGVSGMVLVGATVFRIRQVRRRTAATDSPETVA